MDMVTSFEFTDQWGLYVKLGSMVMAKQRQRISYKKGI